LKITFGFVYHAPVRAILSPLPWIARAPNHNKTGKQNMLMLSEKAFALLLAVAFSGFAFNTFIA
jgi:hypothetical protein